MQSIDRCRLAARVVACRLVRYSRRSWSDGRKRHGTRRIGNHGVGRLVGPADELRLLGSFVARTAVDGDALVLIGEAGVGKTVLLEASYDELERELAAHPTITVPAVTLDGLADGNFPATDGSASARHFTGPRVHHQVPNAGHNLPQEAPDAFADAVLELARLGRPT